MEDVWKNIFENLNNVIGLDMKVKNVAVDKIAVYPVNELVDVISWLITKEYADSLVIGVYNDAPILIPKEKLKNFNQPIIKIKVDSDRHSLYITSISFKTDNAIIEHKILDGIRNADYTPVINNDWITFEDTCEQFNLIINIDMTLNEFIKKISGEGWKLNELNQIQKIIDTLSKFRNGVLRFNDTMIKYEYADWGVDNIIEYLKEIGEEIPEFESDEDEEEYYNYYLYESIEHDKEKNEWEDYVLVPSDFSGTPYGSVLFFNEI